MGCGSDLERRGRLLKFQPGWTVAARSGNRGFRNPKAVYKIPMYVTFKPLIYLFLT
jgi:hypothetical protein